MLHNRRWTIHGEYKQLIYKISKQLLDFNSCFRKKTNNFRIKRNLHSSLRLQKTCYRWESLPGIWFQSANGHQFSSQVWALWADSGKAKRPCSEGLHHMGKKQLNDIYTFEEKKSSLYQAVVFFSFVIVSI